MSSGLFNLYLPYFSSNVYVKFELINWKFIFFINSRKHLIFCLGKISPAILSKAGNDIDAACLNNPLVSTEHIRVTPAGNLQCKYIFHIITPSSCKELTERIELVLKEAEKMGMTSISLPTLGAGW